MSEIALSKDIECVGTKNSSNTQTRTATIKVFSRDKEMAHSVESTAVDVYSLPPPFLTNSTVVPLSASSRSLVLSGGCVCVGGSGGQRGGKHKGTRHGRSFRSSPIEALQSNSSKKEGEGEKRRLLYFVQSEPSPYLWSCPIQ
jgi:hypothetical protein